MRSVSEGPIPLGRRRAARVHFPGSWATCIRGRFTVDIVFVRLLFIIVVGATCFVIEPFALTRLWDGVVGLGIGGVIVLFGWMLRMVSLIRLIGACLGWIVWSFVAY